MGPVVPGAILCRRTLCCWCAAAPLQIATAHPPSLCCPGTAGDAARGRSHRAGFASVGTCRRISAVHAPVRCALCHLDYQSSPTPPRAHSYPVRLSSTCCATTICCPTQLPAAVPTPLFSAFCAAAHPRSHALPRPDPQALGFTGRRSRLQSRGPRLQRSRPRTGTFWWWTGGKSCRTSA
jgi:hypothetical protein